jgi:hypothetical protein
MFITPKKESTVEDAEEPDARFSSNTTKKYRTKTSKGGSTIHSNFRLNQNSLQKTPIATSLKRPQQAPYNINKLPVPSPHDSIKKRLTFGLNPLSNLDSHNGFQISSDNYNGGFVTSLNTGKFHDAQKTPKGFDQFQQ